MGVFKKGLNKLGNIGHTFANPLATATGHNQDSHNFFDSLNYKVSDPIGQVSPVYHDITKAMGQTAQGIGLAPPDAPPPPDPNAPGSIFNMGLPKGPAYNPAAMPAPGTPTNGLANGTMSGGIDWAPIIARALRKT